MTEIMTTKEVAEYLRVTPMTVMRWVRDKQIPAMRVGRLWRYDRAEIDKCMRRPHEAKDIKSRTQEDVNKTV